ncbi:MAG: hypothetical protein ACR2PG_18735, partial [Hyphomicrobiaceae bacterium]
MGPRTLAPTVTMLTVSKMRCILSTSAKICSGADDACSGEPVPEIKLLHHVEAGCAGDKRRDARLEHKPALDHLKERQSICGRDGSRYSRL